MKIRNSIPLIAFVFALGTGSLLQAADSTYSGSQVTPSQGNPTQASPSQGGTTDAMSDPAAQSSDLSGTVQAIDKTNKTVQIQTPTGELKTVKVASTTEIRRDGLAIKLSDLRKGDNIVVRNAA